MQFKFNRFFPALSVVLWLSVEGMPAAPAPDAAVCVTLWFDTEDYILPESDNAAKRLAETLSNLGVRATFKMVGEKARVLERRGRRDVIEALKKHEIGYHTDFHSRHPTVAEYLQNAGWLGGIAEFLRRERQGFEDTRRIFDMVPACYGQPGSSWATQAYPALRQMGVRAYIDEADHVGIDDQPFFYCGLLNVFKMRSNLTRMELSGNGLEAARRRFRQVSERLTARGGGTISIYYHPCEFVHAEFWDGVNFSRGSNPPPEVWKTPRTKPAAEIERGFTDFRQYIEFIKAQPGVRFVTAADLLRLYEDASLARSYTRQEISEIAKSVRDEISFRTLGEVALSAADCFWLLTGSAAGFVDTGKVPESVRLEQLDGPVRNHTVSGAPAAPREVEWPAFARTISDVSAFCRYHKRVPEEVWLGSVSIPPEDYLATLGGIFDDLADGQNHPARVSLRRGRYTADRFVAADSPGLWRWVIFPEGFRAPQIMEIARLQAWTLKPALLHSRAKAAP